MKLGIVARGATARLAPFSDRSWELWGLPWVRYPRIDAVFEIHEQECWDDEPSDPAADQGARNPEARVYSTLSRAAVFDPLKVEPFPFDEVLAAFPGAPFENTICYQLALALLKEPAELGLWGVDLPITREEYVWERGAVLYWIGRAEQAGVKITLAPGSPLLLSGCEAGRYGVNSKRRFR